MAETDRSSSPHNYNGATTNGPAPKSSYQGSSPTYQFSDSPRGVRYGSGDSQYRNGVGNIQDSEGRDVGSRQPAWKHRSQQSNDPSARDIQVNMDQQFTRGRTTSHQEPPDSFHSIQESPTSYGYDRDNGQQNFSAFQYARGNDAPHDRTRTQSLDSNNVVTSPHENIGEYQLQRTQDICTAYLRGQLSNVAKAAVWWSTFGVVAEALTKMPLAVGTTRLVFNIALVLVSPLAGTVAENANIQTLLNYTTWGRLSIWCGFIPLTWFYFASHLSSFTSFYICFLILMFLDGIQVSFANVVDIDCGGLDTLATQYKLSIGNYLRDRFNRIHQIVFDLSFILLTPPVAFLIWQIAFRFDHRDSPNQSHSSYFSSSSLLPLDLEFKAQSYNGVSFLEDPAIATTTTTIRPVQKAVDSAENTDVAVLMIGICGVFGILSLYSLWSYWGHLSEKNQRRPQQHSNDQQDVAPQSARSDNSMNEVASSSSSSRESSWQLTVDRFRDVKDGFLIVLGERPLGWRLLFLALETALEDAIVSVVIPQIALQMTPLLWKTFYPTSPHLSSSFSTELSGTFPSSFLPSQYVLPPILPGGWTFVNFVAVSLIAIGKSGGLASGAYMSSRWTTPPTIEKSGPYCKLFRCMFYSSASLLALPLAYFFLLEAHPFQLLFSDVWSNRTIDIFRGVCAIVLVAIAGFLFFVFSTAPKIGFATLLHSLVVQRDIDPKVFGFVGTFVTITDAAVILVLNLVFALCGPNQFLLALLISSGIYLLHGIAELTLGPRLILESSSSPMSDDQSVDFPNLFRYNPDTDQSPVVIQPEDGGVDANVAVDMYQRNQLAPGGRVLESSAREFGRDEASIVRNQLDTLEPMVGSWAEAR